MLDPTLGSAYVSRIVYAAMCQKLIDIDEHLNLVPQLATAWTYEDPTHLVLTLRDGVTLPGRGPRSTPRPSAYTINRDLTLKGSMRVGEVNAIASTWRSSIALHIRLVLKAPSTPLLTHARRPRRDHGVAPPGGGGGGGWTSARTRYVRGRMPSRAGWRRTASC